MRWWWPRQQSQTRDRGQQCNGCGGTLETMDDSSACERMSRRDGGDGGHSSCTQSRSGMLETTSSQRGGDDGHGSCMSGMEGRSMLETSC